MESIKDVILFYSTVSPSSIPVVQFIQQYNIPIKLVRLDNSEFRTAVQKGKFFQITVVPTLLVVYTSGQVQLFAGQVKSLEWLKMTISQSTEKETELDTDFSEQSQDFERKPKKKPIRRKEVIKKGKKKSKVQTPPSSSSEEEVIDYLEEEAEQEFVQKPTSVGMGLLTGPDIAAKVQTPNPGQSIKDLAKQMENERLQTLKNEFGEQRPR